MGLPEHEWLTQAKRLAVGQSCRIKHRHEHRLNLVVHNEQDRYWAYCQRCHEGGVVLKDHVKLGDPVAPGQDTRELPTDLVYLHGSDWEVPVARFLATKNMAIAYIDDAMYVSPSKKRLVIAHAHGLHGRDLTGRSAYKWMNYNHQQIAMMRSTIGIPTVVVEDLFSAYKVQWAMRGNSMRVICALGTDIKSSLVRELMSASKVIWFFDNDPAGNTGAMNGVRRTRVHVPNQAVVFPPLGCDPKDMSCADIQSILGGHV